MSIEAAIAVTRFGLGAKAGEIDTVGGDPRAWLLRQLVPKAIASFGARGLSPSKTVLTNASKAARNMRAKTGDADSQKAFRRMLRQTAQAEIMARTTHAVSTEYGFHERLVRFWSNHFTVAANNRQTRLIAGAYEREAIRPHILGSFADLAEQAIFHPGMLIYLNNIQSLGPNSRAGRRRARGLNENLAREVLELHTVSPRANYTQDDVTAFAKALTGWSVGNHRLGKMRQGEAFFSEHLHEPGRQTVLGRRYTDTGGAQAKTILRDLCRSPHTADHIALKLARHFVSDDPPVELVSRLSRVFQTTGGDLKAMYAALIAADETWFATAQKLKTPDEIIVSTGRLIGLKRVFAGDPKRLFESFAQTPFSAPTPQGWPDDAEAWSGPDALMKRIEWANRVAERNAALDARQLLLQGLGARVSAATHRAVARAESPSQAIALALLSPDFQLR